MQRQRSLREDAIVLFLTDQFDPVASANDGIGNLVTMLACGVLCGVTLQAHLLATIRSKCGGSEDGKLFMKGVLAQEKTQERLQASSLASRLSLHASGMMPLGGFWLAGGGRMRTTLVSGAC